MKKLHLDPDQLRVDSFPTASVEKAAGTVQAHATPISYCATCFSACPTNCDCTYGCTRGFPATQCTIYP